MSKRRISQRQHARIKKNQQRHLQLTEQAAEVDQVGLLVAHYGKYGDIEATDGKLYRCHFRQNLGSLVVGDQVIWRAAANEVGVIIALLPRQSLLERPVSLKKTKPVAANIDQIIIVAAVQPLPMTTMLDSYLVAAETLNIPVRMVFNKMDLLSADALEEFTVRFSYYQRIGYPLLFTSTTCDTGLEALQQALQQHTSIFVGQSGVGKSSLISYLIPAVNTRIGEAGVNDHGLHTTTTARLYHLPTGGNIIDSPGVREFSLWGMEPAQIAYGFVEFRDYLNQCKFRDCQHTNELGCALQQAVSQGKIAADRLASFQRIIATFKV